MNLHLFLFFFSACMLYSNCQIDSCIALQNIGLTGNYSFNNDVNCTSFDFKPIGNQSKPFTGIKKKKNCLKKIF